MKLSDAPSELTEAKCKIVYNIRDPKDVAVSLYNAYLEGQHTCYTGSFEDFLPLFLEGKVDCNGLFEHWRDADVFFKAHPDIPVYIQVYEEALKDPFGAVQKLSDFLELERNDDLCRDIAEKCHFSKMKVDKDKFSMKFGSKDIHYRKGVSGDYRNYFNDRMLDDYYNVYKERLSGTRFYLQYLYNS
ncbi:sulfotransferase 1B1-like [Haliotis rubra]|uniref:sulfotransferase 1B1-like n=1 Tax=Haliotis rubra TaxID=36100 RepID=UPI001EE5821C|nr:sulfotransferase 1B1-like [Haliotis rubra]